MNSPWPSAANTLTEEWEARSHDVYLEGQDSFRLRGQSATLAGRPDVMVVRGDDALIVDVKTGREQTWHAVQVMTYIYALPRAIPQYRDARLAGELIYTLVQELALPAQSRGFPNP